MALALDGSVHKNITSGSSTTVSLTTSAAGVVVAVLTINNTQGLSITSANTSGWTLRARYNPVGASYLEEWAGVSAGALSSEVITITLVGSVSYCTIDVFGVSGADTVAIWDANAALPDTGGTGDRSITTSSADCFLIGSYRFQSTASPTQGTGWTKISGADFQLTEYKIVSATQSGTDVAIGTGSGDNNAGIGDAIVSAGGGGGATMAAGQYYRLAGLADGQGF